MKKIIALCPLWLCLLAFALCPVRAEEVRREIRFPDLPDGVTLTCDLHMHSVFSDGLVWPTVRVKEGWRMGLDLIAISDHIEHLPHKQDMVIALNRSFELARGPAAERGLLLARSAEITRDTPPGHFNAIFTRDNDALNVPDFVEAVKRANEQGAFVFWNHQGWKGPELGKWMDVHTIIFENKWLHGMEVCNGENYYPDAHRWCLEKNLAMLGNSDIHDPDLREASKPDDHRTMTLVFAKERSLSAMKDALLQGRTAVWHKDQLIGKQDFLEPLFRQCVGLRGKPVWRNSAVWLQFENKCAMDIRLKGAEGNGQELTLPSLSTTLVKIGAKRETKSLTLKYTVANFIVRPETGLPAVFEIVREKPVKTAENAAE